jgi:uncharacterized protein YegP (UPF0339 family)
VYTKYRDASRQWRWRYETNFRVIAVSSEAYVNEADCDRSIEIMKNSSNSPVHRE